MLADAAGRPAKPTPSSPWLKSTNNLWLAFLLASAWTTLEWLRGWIFTGWGWNGLGAALHNNWPIIQIAEFTGAAGLSFVLAFTNVIALTTVRRMILETRGRVMRPHYDATLTLSAIVGLLAFGWHVARIPRPAIPIRVAAVQANIAREENLIRSSPRRFSINLPA
jgi:apolipoprotein N-acyltransferase